MVKNRKNKQSGFTLIELLVAIAIFALFIVLASSSLVNVLKMEQKTNVLRQTQTDARYILETLSREARSANGELNKKGERVKHAYDTSATGGFSLYIYNTDLVAGKVTKVQYYYPTGTTYLFYRYSSEKTIEASDATYVQKTSTALNNTNDLRITGFSCTLVLDNSDFSKPPFLQNITLKAESSLGNAFIKDQYRAAVEFRTSVTPRNY